MKYIYLDSADFSVLSEDSLPSREAEILAHLRKRSIDASYKFVVSSIHLSEVVHATEASRPLALKRAKLLKELCAGNFVLFPTDVMKLEAERFLSAGPLITIDDILAPDSWFGLPYPPSLKTPRPQIQSLFDEKIRELPINRAGRRRLRRQTMPFKRTSAEALRELGKFADESRFPLNLLPKEVIMKWACGEIPDAVFSDHIMYILRDPVHLIEYVLDNTGERETLYSLVRNRGISFVEFISNIALKSDVPILYERNRRAAGKKGNDKPAQIVDSLLSHVKPEDFLSRLDARLEGIDGVGAKHFFGRSPASRCFFGVIKFKLRSAMLARIAKQAFMVPQHYGLVSDYGDLAHSVYAPYVSAFRCDRAFGEVLGSIKPRLTNILPIRSELLAI